MKIKDLKLHIRLDVFVKVIYVKAFISKTNFVFAQKLYRKHIALYNGGQEDHKSTLWDFETDFQDLIYSCLKKWFDTHFPIPVNPDGELLGGAHRLACCLALDLTPTFIIQDWNPIIWWEDWFIKHSFNELSLIHILQEFNIYHDDLKYIVIWPNLVHQIDSIKKIFTKNGISTAIYFPVKINKYHFQELVYDIYCFDQNIKPSLGIDAKIESSYDKNWKIWLLLTEKIPKNTKEKIRQSIIKQNSHISSKYHTFHSPDNKEEEKYLKAIFSYNNVSHLFKRKYVLRKKFINKLEQLEYFLVQNNINKNSTCIVWSGPLWVFWITQVSDIDIICTTYNNTWIIQNWLIDILDYQYHPLLQNKEIIENKKYHFYFRWFKFIALYCLKEIKIQWTREKDIKQVEKINNFLRTNKSIISRERIYMLAYTFYKIMKIRCICTIIKITKKVGAYKYISYFWKKYILKI